MINNIQININAHGHENLSYMHKDFITRCVMSAYDDGFKDYIGALHMNPEHPENHNVRGRSKRLHTMEVFDGQKWSLTPAVPVLDNLIQKGCKVFWSHLMCNLDGDFKDEDLQSVIQKQLKDLSDVTKKRKSETYYKIRRNLFFMFFQDQPDNFVLVAEPEGQDIVEPTLNALTEPMS